MTIMTNVGEYFSATTNAKPKSELSSLIAHVNELNRAITGAMIAEELGKACKLMNELRLTIQRIGSIGGTEAVKPVVDALADSAAAYANNRFPEAKALREASIEVLGRIGKESVPWIREGFTHSNPAVRKACYRAFKACKGNG